ncbi:SMP-30/gluconolactonase/LRE family protein [Allostreptomyces psammosilenae]|uniref:Sugar lactone lactonase YvrE n=1 Tax=Allostreptomyces psammosilenae TaxID=1892865 RepID=A0A852ZYN2_9ACTN|nr:SMP-30/gluconolactonase/LRE family protein [Allostreptomyces psammosilenae]NYI03721.1 sugar lactone lactonase YvrE [Allostreptomyces psammosilenae]
MSTHLRTPEVGTEFTPVAVDRLELGEGVRILRDGRVVLVDILAGRLLSLPDTPGAPLIELARLEEPLGAVAPLAAGAGFLAAAGTGFTRLAPDGNLISRTSLPDLEGWPPRRMNDAACDAQGRFWAGSMAYDAAPGAGALHRLDPDGTVVTVLKGLTVPNGPAVSPDGATLYLADSAEGTVYAYDMDPATGALSGRRVFFRLAPGNGSPDGMTVDDEGRLWSAVWGAAQVRCYAPDGRLLLTLDVPAQQPTSVCLTGNRLIVTTARYGLPAPSPLDGAVLSVPCDATAPPAASRTVCS